MEKISENYKTLIDQKMVQAGLDKVLSYEVFNDPKFKIKDDCKLGSVSIAPKLFRDNTNITDVIIIFNEKYLDRLGQVKDAPLLDLAIDKVLAAIYFSYEKDDIKKASENVVEFSSILKKYGVDLCIDTYRLAISQIKDDTQED